LRRTGGDVLLLPCSPCRGGEVGESLYGNIGNPRQHGGQIVANRNLHPSAGFHYGQNRRHLRPRLLAAYMDPVFAIMRTCT
jgi:hypothetical protein